VALNERAHLRRHPLDVDDVISPQAKIDPEVGTDRFSDASLDGHADGA
jgi:hypothetical protein